ncbi:MAG: glycosyltransferase [Candidatus Aenigmarchaeota archaeon]|nr:glycosyltransferase [Candidatus Aenigmarchaeota archaeon]
MTNDIRTHFDDIAQRYDYYKSRQRFYYKNLKALYASIVPPGKRVLELGCGTGDLVASLRPSVGVGVDISPKMVAYARKKHPEIKFVVSPAEDLNVEGKFDYIIMADLVEHLSDVYATLQGLRKNCTPQTKIVITSINPFWTIPLHVMERLNMKMPEGPHNWIAHEDLARMLRLLDYTIVKRRLSIYTLVQTLVAQPAALAKSKGLSVSVVIPAYNEEGNIAECIKRVPNVGKDMEIVVVDDGSKDRTAERANNAAKHDKRVRVVSYAPNRGKGMAVKAGLDAATKEVVVVLDADMAVPPEELPRFIEPLAQGKAEFVNGTRLLYPFESGAMTDLHMIGNKAFARVFSWLLGSRVTDTLCGTKAYFRKAHGTKIKLVSRSWPDFDMLFGASRSNMRIVEVPVHYMKRVAGESKMKTWQHGFKLGMMCIRGFWELKIKKRLGRA